MEERLYYKIVKTPNSNIYPGWWWSVSPIAPVSYRVGEVTERPSESCGPLAAFDSYKDAERFLDRLYKSTLYTYSIFTCKIEISTESYESVLAEFWDGVVEVPYGTIFANSVILMERIL